MGKIKQYLLSPVSIRILTVGLSFIANVLINRSLGLVLKGQYTTILNYANFLQLFLNLGICYAYPLLKKTEKIDKAKQLIMTVVWLQTFAFAVISAIVFLIIPNIRILMIILLSTVMICNSQIVFIALIDDIKKRNLFLLSSTVLFIFSNAVCILIAPGQLYLIVALLIIRYLYEIIVIVKKNQYAIFSISSLNQKKLLYLFYHYITFFPICRLQTWQKNFARFAIAFSLPLCYTTLDSPLDSTLNLAVLS